MNARLIKTFTKRMTKTTRSTLTESIRKTITVVFLCALVLPVPMETSGGGETVPGSTGYIDTHMHLLGMGRGRGGPVKDYEAAAAGLVKLMDQMNVSKALIMPPPQHSGQQGGYDYRELLKAVKKFPQRLVLAAGGGILNPMIHGTDRSAVTNGVKKRFRKEAEQLLKAGAKAFGEMTAMHVSMNPRHPILETSPDHPLFLLLADIAAENNVPIDLHMEAVPKEMATPRVLFKRSSRNPDTLKANIPALERLLKHNRKARIVWQHIGWDNTGEMTVSLLKRLLKAHPNLYLSLRVEEPLRVRAGGSLPNRIVDENWKIKNEWMVFIKAFPDRFMLGGDEFVGIPGRSRRMPQSFEETWPILKQLPSQLAKQLGHSNPARVYNLK